MHATSKPSLVALGALVMMVAPDQGGAQPAIGDDRRPTIAVFDFENGSFPDNDSYQPLRKGMSRMLGSELARNPGVRVVERQRIQEVLTEQNFQKSDRVDQSTAVRFGKILGARHLIMGSFTVDQGKSVRIDIYALDTETSQQVYSETVEGKADRILDLVRQLGAKVNAGMKLPDIPIAFRSSPGSLGPNQEKISQILSRAEEEVDRGNVKYAAELLKSAVALNTNYDVPRVRLALLEKQVK